MPPAVEPTPEQVLNFEALWPRHSGYKESAIIAELGVAPARYYMLLRRAADSLEGQEHDPVTAHRVQRLGSHAA